MLALSFLPALAALALLAPGCATRNVNPPQARAKTGYVDLYAESAGEWRWQMARFDGRARSFKDVFSEWELPPGRVLRLAFPPGHHRLRVMITNRAVREPGLVEVEVRDGLITPVHVVLVPDGKTLVQTSEERRGPTYQGRYGRSTKFGADETTMYRISAEANASVPYQVKEQMPYAR